MTGPSLIDPFHRQIRAALEKEIESRMSSLAEGTAEVGNDPAKTGMMYMKEVGFIRALLAMKDRCEEIEKDMYGAREAAE